MDCEKFESAMMDELYGELDELTSAAAKRHVAGCARCTALIGGLRATRRVATVPLVDLPAGLEERILAAAREAQKVVPIRRRAARVISLAGSWAMRPQTAMAALFLVMIGTSVLLLRGKGSRAPATSEMTVTEQGAPAPMASAVSAPTAAALDPTVTTMPAASAAVAARAAEAKPAPPPSPADLPDDQRLAHGKGGWAKDKDDEGLIANAAAPAGAPNMLPPATQAGPVGGFGQSAGGGQQNGLQGEKKAQLSPFDTALQSYRAGRFDDATRAFDALAPGDPSADLQAARAVREGKGCRNAVARFDKVAQRAAGSPTGWDALLEGGACYRAIGDLGNARVRFNALLGVDSHKDKARAELDRINQLQQAQGSTGPAQAAARPSPRKAAAPAAAPPAATATAVDSSF